MRKLIVILLIMLNSCAMVKPNPTQDAIGVTYESGVYIYCYKPNCQKPTLLEPITADELKPLTPDVVIPPIELSHTSVQHKAKHKHHKHKRRHHKKKKKTVKKRYKCSVI